MSTILIVEDHAMSRHVLTTLLGYYGHKLLEATDGAIALELAHAERPDLIITDIVMPNMDGIEFVRRLRAEKGMEEIPVVFYTATYRLPEARRMVAGFGNCQVLPKPSEPAVILRIVNETLGISPAEEATSLPMDSLDGLPRWSAELQLAALVDLSFHLVSQREPSRLLDVSCNAVRGILKCRYVQLALLEENGQVRYFGDDRGDVPDGISPSEVLPLREILEQVVSQRQILRNLPSAGQAEESGRPTPFESPLIIPFATPDRVYGWIGLGDKSDGLPFSDDEEDMAVSLGNQAALAYENLLLSKNLRQNVEELHDREERLRLVIESSKMGTWDLDLLTGRLNWSDRCKAIFGLSPDAQVDFQSFLDRVHPDDRHIIHEVMQRALDPGGAGEYSSEYRSLRPDGTERWLAGMGKTLFDFVDGRRSAVRIAGTVLDITERKRGEQALEKLNAELENRVAERTAELREKDQILLLQSRQAAMGEMIGNIAHQWRQPLNVLGLTAQQLLLYYDMGEFDRTFLAENVDNLMKLIHHMSRTIDDFRDYFKPGKEKVEFKVREAIANALSLLEGSLQNPQISVEIAAKGDPVIYGYENEFSQVFINIVINAKDVLTEREIEGPKVTITISSEDNCAVVTVADNAGGIPEEIMGKIFEPYFTTKGPQGGTGVGLFMSKAIIEKNMGGRLAVRNIANGAEFKIEVCNGMHI